MFLLMKVFLTNSISIACTGFIIIIYTTYEFRPPPTVPPSINRNNWHNHILEKSDESSHFSSVYRKDQEICLLLDLIDPYCHRNLKEIHVQVFHVNSYFSLHTTGSWYIGMPWGLTSAPDMFQASVACSACLFFNSMDNILILGPEESAHIHHFY